MPPLPGSPTEPERRQRGLLAEALSAGITFPVAIFVGYLGGRGIDHLLGSAPLGLVVGILLGFAAALVPIFRLSAAWERAEAERRKRTGGADPGDRAG